MEFRAAERRELCGAGAAAEALARGDRRDLFVASHGGVARALMHLLGGLAPDIAAEANIHQGRAMRVCRGRVPLARLKLTSAAIMNLQVDMIRIAE